MSNWNRCGMHLLCCSFYFKAKAFYNRQITGLQFEDLAVQRLFVGYFNLILHTSMVELYKKSNQGRKILVFLDLTNQKCENHPKMSRNCTLSGGWVLIHHAVFSIRSNIPNSTYDIFRISDLFAPPPPLEEISSNEFKKISTLKTPAECTTAERRNELSSLANTSTLKVLQQERNLVSEILTFIFDMERVLLQPPASQKSLDINKVYLLLQDLEYSTFNFGLYYLISNGKSF